jgi:hypothetical protein
MLKDDFEGFSTLVRGYFSKYGPHSGTGFFYCESHRQCIDNTKINIHTDFVKNKIWLVTVRHNLYPAPPQVQQIIPPSESYEERLPFEFSIHLKSNNSPKWDQVILSEDDLLKNGRIHSNDDVDIAAIEVSDILKDKFKGQNNHYIDYYAFNKRQFPTAIKSENSEIVIVGFPVSNNGTFNLLVTKPEVRSGAIKSTWGSSLGDLPAFEVNTIAGMGFSGSPAIAILKDSKLDHKTTLNGKHISFLGVSAGISRENSGTIIYYGNLVEEIIKDGLPLFSARYRHIDRYSTM